MIVALEPWHLVSIALRMRESDVRDLEVCGIKTDPVSRQRWACRTALECVAGVAAVDDAGRPVGCFGIRETTPRVGVAFLVTTDGWLAHLRDGIRAWRKFREIAPWARIEATVASESKVNATFLLRMGFDFDCRLPSVRDDGGDLLLFSMRGA